MTPTGFSDKLLELIAYEAVVVIIQRVEIARDDVTFLVHEQGALEVKDADIVKSMADDCVNIALHMVGHVDLAFFLKFYYLLSHTPARVAKFFILQHLIFFRKAEQPEQVQPRIYLLPKSKCNKRDERTGEYPVDTVVFLHDLLAQPAGVFVLALQVDRYPAVALEIIFRVDESALCVQAVAVVVDVVAHDIQPLTYRYGNIGTFREKFEQELKQLPASVLVSFRKITVLPFDGQIVVNEVGCFQDKVIVKGHRHDKYLTVCLPFLRRHVDGALRFDSGAQQSPFQTFLDHAWTGPGSSREEEAMRPFLNGQGGICCQCFKVREVLFSP